MLEHIEYFPLTNTGGQNEFVSLSYNNSFWGAISERRLDHPNYTISHFKADLHDDFAVAFNDERLENSVNICISLEGYTGVRFSSSEFALTTLKQHSLYIPENQYRVLVKKSMDNVHFAIDRNYYLSLIGETEDWACSIREKIENRALMYGGEFDVTSAMMRVVGDILNNQFSGSLKALMVEAKILELIALQLECLVKGKNNKNKLTRKERDVFFSLRDYLDKTFMDNHSLKGLGKTFGINECKLKSGFKELFELTIFDYIHTRRMDYAFQLLREENLLVNEVAGKVGYKNPNHFSTAFKKRFGITPGKV
jgi:AraC-like DNA-binding protein